MPEMRITAGTPSLSSHHAVGLIGLFCYRLLIDRLPEAWPARARFKLGVRGEQRLSTAHAGVCASVLGLPVFAGKCRLCSCLAGYLVLLRRQLLFPIFFRLRNLVGH